MIRRTQTRYQYEPLVTPSAWEGDERRFSIRLGMILDALHQRMGEMQSADRVYPVGSYYLSAVSADPGRLFGGVWEKAEGVFDQSVYAWRRTA